VHGPVPCLTLPVVAPRRISILTITLSLLGKKHRTEPSFVLLVRKTLKKEESEVLKLSGVA
jgi:hypothetical protein